LLSFFVRAQARQLMDAWTREKAELQAAVRSRFGDLTSLPLDGRKGARHWRKALVQGTHHESDMISFCGEWRGYKHPSVD
jgi:hypothetical protein